MKKDDICDNENEPIVFLGGPITHLSYAPNDQYRRTFATVFSTLSKHAKIKSAHMEEDFGNIYFPPDEIARRDLEWIDCAHILLFIFPDCLATENPLRTDGTFIELGYAASKQKPTAVFIPDISKHSLLTQGVLQNKPWICQPCVTAESIIQTAFEMLDAFKQVN